ncbi:MAG: CRISPR-associated helicase Cas3' [Metallibacterium scheffleri]|jgi:CRISPR-associated helicase Cas3/CRISPR-associated endonuclease Cas3-HD|nr:CRISPR-associated helicase Cas3' [Metallibacterium scheffleri]MCK9367872.1 CRISPR-associated helicase Cas3' [Metallibacterium scheffleri]
MYYAHSANDVGNWHPLAVHLGSVANLAKSFASESPWYGEAQLAGLLHDLGKYADRFQRRLHGEDSGLDHWSQGAALALTKHQAVAAALAIQGHHIGLQRGDTDTLKRLHPATLANAVLPSLQLSDPDLDALTARALADGLQFAAPATHCIQAWHHAVAAMLDVRLLFSCLTDADFLDTEAHFNGDENGKRPRAAGPALDPAIALAALDRFMADSIRHGSRATDDVHTVRETLWRACGDAATAAPGAFTLTAPTGSGKTLAMLRFALEHARKHGLNRIVLAVPFLTVIEQTAAIYRRVFADFPANFVLEHHSLAGVGEESEREDAESGASRQRRLLSENWDAPIVLTTNVQLLESLFSNRPSACRKLHRLMRSVVIFDEAQSLPAMLAVPTLAALSHLSSAYKSSVVFATATQPAFDTLSAAVSKHAVAGWKPTEIVAGHADLFKKLERVNVEWRVGKTNWQTLAAELESRPQALVVCNLKRHALALLETLQVNAMEGVFHLSTNLCADHRRAVLDWVRKRLASGQPCRLISTQCVEAGVDVDFPVVYRAFGPLDAIAQAAGRCNREGRLNAQGKFGRVIVFEPDDTGEARRQYPTFAYYQAAEVTRALLTEHGELDINDPAIFRKYYKKLYDVADPATMNNALEDAIQARDFVEVARRYRLIEQNTFQLLVPWIDRRDEFQALRIEAEQAGISARWMRRAQGLAVSVYKPRDAMPAWAIPAKLKPFGRTGGGVSDEWFILEGDYYDDTIGLVPPEGPQLFIA